MEKKEIAALKLDSTKPTRISFKLLRDWVVWQFPRKVDSGFIGAVHPPLEKYGWFPATIQIEKQVAYVYGHLSETFASPEQAADFLSANGRSPEDSAK